MVRGDTVRSAKALLSRVNDIARGAALMTSTTSFIQGIGDAKFSLIIALLDGVVARISLSWILGVLLGKSFFGGTLGMGELGPAFGFFLGYNLATYVTALPSTAYFFIERWRKRDLLV